MVFFEWPFTPKTTVFKKPKSSTALNSAEIYGMQVLARINYDSKILKEKKWLYNNFRPLRLKASPRGFAFFPPNN